MNVVIAPKIGLTLPILQEVNIFTRCSMRNERVSEIPCFSDPVRTAWVCNPTQNPVPEGKDGDKDYCAINWICKIYYAGRLGIGLNPDEPYNFEKSKEFAKKLSYDQLLKQIELKATSQPETPVEAVVMSQQESQVEDKKLLEAKLVEQPTQPITQTKLKTDKPALPPLAKSDKPKITPQAISGYNPGSLGHVLLFNLPIDPEPILVTREQLWKAAVERKFSSEGRFNTMLAKLVEDKLVESPSTDMYRRVK